MGVGPESKRAINSSCFPYSTLTGSVIGFYFGRTNHQRVGGIGPFDGGR